MEKKTLTNILIVEGAASKWNQDVFGHDDKTISHWTLPYALKFFAGKLRGWREILSGFLWGGTWAIKQYFKKAKPEDNQLIIAKSKGCVRVFEWLKRNPEYFKLKTGKTAILFVDGHSKIKREIFSRLPPYGKRRHFDRADIFGSYRNNVRIFNVYQHNKWPHGAYFLGADCQVKIKDKDVDHFSIIKTPTVQHYLQAACEWLDK